MPSNTHKHNIYISYAEADKDWVIHFVKLLKNHLKGQLGQIDNVDIWAKYMLKGTEDVNLTPKKHLENSDILFTILSPAYEKMKVEQEVTDFIDSGGNIENIFVVEYRKIVDNQRHTKIKNLYGYRFWYEDEMQKIRQKPTQDYHDLMSDIASELAEKIEKSQKRQQSSCVVYFSHATDDLRERRNDLKRFFESKGFYVSTKKINEHSEFEDKKQIQFFILLGEINLHNQFECQYAKDNDIPIFQWYNGRIITAASENAENITICNNYIITASEDFETFKNDIIKRIEKETKKQKECHVFISANECDKKIAQEIQNELKKHSIKSNLRMCDMEEKWNAVIIVFDKAPLEWVEEQICQQNLCYNETSLKIITVFNNPPPETFSLPVKLSDIKVFTLRRITETIDEFVNLLKKVCV